MHFEATDPQIGKALAAPLGTESFDIDSLRKAALPLNGADHEAIEVVHQILQSERVGKLQVARECNPVLSDEQAVHCARKLIARLDGLKAETICDFLIKSIPPISDTHWTPMIDGITYQDRTEATEIFGDRDRGWDLFRARFPHTRGIIEFSRVGFDPQISQALLNYGAQYDWLAGNGKIVFLQRADDDWKVCSELGTWVS